MARILRRPAKIFWRRLTLALLSLCLLAWLSWTLLLQVGFGLPGYIDFFLHQGKYQSVVQKAKSLSLASGASTSVTIEGMKVWVKRSQQRFYTVEMVTKDWDHAGVYGYIYSDAIVRAAPCSGKGDDNDKTLPNRSLPESNMLPFVSQQITNHWWSVYNED